MTGGRIHIDGTLDGQTDLLDRQIVTSDGAMLAKVDDIELEERAGSSRLVVTGFLVGPGALGKRLGGALAYVTVNTWSRLARREPDDPRRIDYTHVTDISTVVTIAEARERTHIDGFETWSRFRVIEALPGSGKGRATPGPSRQDAELGDGPTAAGRRHRFSDLAGMTIRFANGTEGDHVTDVRLSKGPPRGHLPELVTNGLIVGRGRPGTLFGYDRDRQRGPWLIQQILRRAHRHSGYVDWDDIASISWDTEMITLRTNALGSLTDL